MKWLEFLPELLILTVATDVAQSQNNINNHRDSRQSSGVNQRAQVLPASSNSAFSFNRPQIQSPISSAQLGSQSGRNTGNFVASSEDKLTSADTSYGLGYQTQPIQGRFWSGGNNQWNNNNYNRGWGWNNNNNQWSGGFWNTGWNQGSVVGQKPGSCGRPVPYNSFNQNLNAGYYFDRSDDDETKTVSVVDVDRRSSKSKRQAETPAEKKSDGSPPESKKLVKRGYSSGPTPYYQGGSFGAGVGYLSGYSLGYNNNRYHQNNQYSGGFHGGNGGYYGGGGFHGGNGIGGGWYSGGRSCYRDYDCPGNKKCCGGLCTNPLYIG